MKALFVSTNTTTVGGGRWPTPFANMDQSHTVVVVPEYLFVHTLSSGKVLYVWWVQDTTFSPMVLPRGQGVFVVWGPPGVLQRIRDALPVGRTATLSQIRNSSNTDAVYIRTNMLDLRAFDPQGTPLGPTKVYWGRTVFGFDHNIDCENTTQTDIDNATPEGPDWTE